MVCWRHSRRPPLYVGIDARPVGGSDPRLLIGSSEGVLEHLGEPHVPVVIVSRLDELRIVGDQNF